MEAMEVLKEKAAFMRDNPGITVMIEGHCDERGTNEYNLALGDRRANSAKTYLTDLGIQGSRMTTVSYGEEQPVDSGHGEEAWARNRRGHFVIIE
jgi:peptidoglycan-associated lipoprotein